MELYESVSSVKFDIHPRNDLLFGATLLESKLVLVVLTFLLHDYSCVLD
jgi:hypothetical protein